MIAAAEPTLRLFGKKKAIHTEAVFFFMSLEERGLQSNTGRITVQSEDWCTAATPTDVSLEKWSLRNYSCICL